MSFHVKHTVTCICIERNVSNSRPMLCMGCKSGEIMVYYVDEPILNRLTGKPLSDGRVREKLFKLFNFNAGHHHTHEQIHPSLKPDTACDPKSPSMANNQSTNEE